MSILSSLRHPHGFADSTRWAIADGKLFRWEWPNQNPEDFSLDENGNIYHNCDDKKSWSRIVRHGQDASNFFEKVSEKKVDSSFIKKKQRDNKQSVQLNTSYKGKIQLRKKKYKNKKYKNSRRRRRRVCADKKHEWRKKRKREKTFKKERASVERQSVFTPSCKYCLTDECFENIYLGPRVKYSCDGCEQCFDGPVLEGHVCEFCLYADYRYKFCDECTKNLGEWEPDWRMKLDIPQYAHPRRCHCQECFQYRQVRPCIKCGMTCHEAEICPWRSWIEDAQRWMFYMYGEGFSVDFDSLD